MPPASIASWVLISAGKARATKRRIIGQSPHAGTARGNSAPRPHDKTPNPPIASAALLRRTGLFRNAVEQRLDLRQDAGDDDGHPLGIRMDAVRLVQPGDTGDAFEKEGIED